MTSPRKSSDQHLSPAPERKSALITGITGQDGLYLSELLLGEGLRGLRPDSRPEQPEARTCWSGSCPGVKMVTGDLTDLSSLMRALAVGRAGRGLQPGRDLVRRVLVGERPADQRGDRPRRAEHAGGDPALLRRRRLARVRFYQASSSEMFGKVQQVPQSESTLLWPRSPYGVAKVFGHYMTINYRESYGMHASFGDPVQPRVAAPRRRSSSPARSARRWPGSRSGCRTRRRWATWTPSGTGASPATTSTRCGGCCSSEKADDYVVATGETHSIREFLDIAFARVGIDDWASYVRIDQTLIRPAEVDLLIGDATKAHPARLEADGVVPRTGRDDGAQRHQAAVADPG